ncbi:MAG: geranylgeranylglyceryl/heptaprenylglyceryl phosphate synthase [Candidatus Thalassarchaeaceae archaeon]
MTEKLKVLAHLTGKNKQTKHAILIDPADQTPDVAAKRCLAAVNAGSSMILIGGSSDTDTKNVDATVIAIKEILELVIWAKTQDSMKLETTPIPIVLFPQGAAALSSSADAVTFMMLMNSTSPRFLIEEQVAGAPHIKKSNIEPLPMGYLVCAPGGKVGEVGKAKLIQKDDIKRVQAYALTAEYYGFRLLYLEAGSGANEPVNPELIKAAREACDLTIIVGGGIRDGQTAKRAASAGADWIITGNLAEEYDDADELQRVLTNFIKDMNA